MVCRWMLAGLTVAACVFGRPPGASAQYMFLDTDGDGLWSSADTLSYPGANNIDVWVVTNLNRDGSEGSCGGVGDLSILSYGFILRASGAGVIWESYQNAQSSMTVKLGEASGGTEFYRAYGGLGSLPPGQYLLGTIVANIVSPTVAIQIVPDTPLGGFATSFGSSCTGLDNNNTLKLGSDWFDVDGTGTVNSFAFVGGGFAGIVTSSGEGQVYLGGNRIDGPYELAYVSGQIAVNGRSLPIPAARISPTRDYSAVEKEEFAFEQRVGDVADSLRLAGSAPEDIIEMLRAMCSANSHIDSVAVSASSLTWRFSDGKRVQIDLAARTGRGLAVDRARIQESELKHVRELIDMGATVFILGPGRRVIIPKSMATHVDSLVSRLRSGGDLEGEDAKRLPPKLQAQLRDPVRLVRVK